MLEIYKICTGVKTETIVDLQLFCAYGIYKVFLILKGFTINVLLKYVKKFTVIIVFRFIDSLPDLEELESKLNAYYALEKETKR